MHVTDVMKDNYKLSGVPSGIANSAQRGHQVWDSRSVTPGVYFYTLSVGEFTKTGKIVINK